MKNIHKAFRGGAAAMSILLGFLLSGCGDTSSGGLSFLGDGNTGQVSVRVAVSNAPTSISSYTLVVELDPESGNATHASSQTIEAGTSSTNYFGGDIVFDQLFNDTYDINIRVRDASGTLVAQGTDQAIISDSSQTVSISMNLRLVGRDSASTLTLNIGLVDDFTIDYTNAILDVDIHQLYIDSPASTQRESATVTQGTQTFSFGSLLPGFYLITASIMEGTATVVHSTLQTVVTTGVRSYDLQLANVGSGELRILAEVDFNYQPFALIQIIGETDNTFSRATTTSIDTSPGQARNNYSASNSFDLDGTVASYAWTVDPSVDVVINDANQSQTRIDFGTNGTYTITVEVDDNAGAASTQSITVFIED